MLRWEMLEVELGSPIILRRWWYVLSRAHIYIPIGIYSISLHIYIPLPELEKETAKDPQFSVYHISIIIARELKAGCSASIESQRICF